MTLYLAQFTLVTAPYMAEREERRPAIRLIEASSIEEAMTKLDARYARVSSAYCVTYSTEHVEITEMIR